MAIPLRNRVDRRPQPGQQENARVQALENARRAFSEVDFHMENWEELDDEFYRDGTVIEHWRDEKPVMINGQEFWLAVKRRRETQVKNPDVYTVYTYSLEDEDGRLFLQMIIPIQQDSETGIDEVKPHIRRYRPHVRSNGELNEDVQNRLPAGAGIVFYEKGMDYIESLAQTRPIKDVCIPNPVDMSRAAWQERFVPVLKERGYEENQWGEWEKIYPVRADQAVA